MEQSIFQRMQAHEYEQIVFCQEKTCGLKASIVIHSTTLGPAMPTGCAMRSQQASDVV
jgi:glutamate dehydrogenase/leucine dehydrogenase